MKNSLTSGPTNVSEVRSGEPKQVITKDLYVIKRNELVKKLGVLLDVEHADTTMPLNEIEEVYNDMRAVSVDTDTSDEEFASVVSKDKSVLDKITGDIAVLIGEKDIEILKSFDILNSVEDVVTKEKRETSWCESMMKSASIAMGRIRDMVLDGDISISQAGYGSVDEAVSAEKKKIKALINLLGNLSTTRDSTLVEARQMFESLDPNVQEAIATYYSCEQGELFDMNIEHELGEAVTGEERVLLQEYTNVYTKNVEKIMKGGDDASMSIDDADVVRRFEEGCRKMVSAIKKAGYNKEIAEKIEALVTVERGLDDAMRKRIIGEDYLLSDVEAVVKAQDIDTAVNEARTRVGSRVGDRRGGVVRDIEAKVVGAKDAFKKIDDFHPQAPKPREIAEFKSSASVLLDEVYKCYTVIVQKYLEAKGEEEVGIKAETEWLKDTFVRLTDFSVAMLMAEDKVGLNTCVGGYERITPLLKSLKEINPSLSDYIESFKKSYEKRIQMSEDMNEEYFRSLPKSEAELQKIAERSKLLEERVGLMYERRYQQEQKRANLSLDYLTGKPKRRHIEAATICNERRVNIEGFKNNEIYQHLLDSTVEADLLEAARLKQSQDLRNSRVYANLASDEEQRKYLEAKARGEIFHASTLLRASRVFKKGAVFAVATDFDDLFNGADIIGAIRDPRNPTHALNFLIDTTTSGAASLPRVDETLSWNERLLAMHYAYREGRPKKDMNAKILSILIDILNTNNAREELEQNAGKNISRKQKSLRIKYTPKLAGVAQCPNELVPFFVVCGARDQEVTNMLRNGLVAEVATDSELASLAGQIEQQCDFFESIANSPFLRDIGLDQPEIALRYRNVAQILSTPEIDEKGLAESKSYQNTLRAINNIKEAFPEIFDPKWRSSGVMTSKGKVGISDFVNSSNRQGGVEVPAVGASPSYAEIDTQKSIV